LRPAHPAAAGHSSRRCLPGEAAISASFCPGPGRALLVAPTGPIPAGSLELVERRPGAPSLWLGSEGLVASALLAQWRAWYGAVIEGSPPEGSRFGGGAGGATLFFFPKRAGR